MVLISPPILRIKKGKITNRETSIESISEYIFVICWLLDDFCAPQVPQLIFVFWCQPTKIIYLSTELSISDPFWYSPKESAPKINTLLFVSWTIIITLGSISSFMAQIGCGKTGFKHKVGTWNCAYEAAYQIRNINTNLIEYICKTLFRK